MPESPILERMAAQKLTLLVEGRGVPVVVSDRPGLAAIRRVVFQHGALLDGADVALDAVSLSVAYLLISAKAGRVYGRLMTHEAHEALKAEGIEHGWAQRAKALPGDDPEWAQLDERARSSLTANAFAEELRRALP